jgi:hypothetical protein
VVVTAGQLKIREGTPVQVAGGASAPAAAKSEVPAAPPKS